MQNRAAHVLHGLSDPTAVELAKLLTNSLASELPILLIPSKKKETVVNDFFRSGCLLFS
jgi:hypothetical protein